MANGNGDFDAMPLVEHVFLSKSEGSFRLSMEELEEQVDFQEVPIIPLIVIKKRTSDMISELNALLKQLGLK